MMKRPFALPTIGLLLVAATGLTLSAQTPRVLDYGPAPSVGMNQTALDEAVDLFRQAVARDEIRGAVLLVARRGTIVMHEAIGWRHVAYRLPMEKDTLFRLASNTKPVVASAMLLLEQDGKLSVGDRAGAHLPPLDNYRWREVTIAHLLSHSSGIRIGPILLPFDEDKDKREPPTLQAAAAKFGAFGPEFTPGTTYSYNNAGYNTLGAIIERASGMTLEDSCGRACTNPSASLTRSTTRMRRSSRAWLRFTVDAKLKLGKSNGRKSSRRAIRRIIPSSARRAA